MKQINSLTDSDFISILKESTSIAEVLFKLGYSVAGNTCGYNIIKQRMLDLDIDGSIFKGKSIIKNHKNQYTYNDLFIENCKVSRHVLRSYIIRNKILEYKCSICECKNWQGKELSLELDHINGINNDNRIENLRFLCPNCHSQTITYGSKNSVKKHKDISYDISEESKILIENTYKEHKSIKKVSSILDISYSVVRKVITDSKLKHNNLVFVIRYDENMNELMRFGTLKSAAEYLIKNKEVKTNNVKTCTRTIDRNKNKFWLNSFWKLEKYSIIK